jgi:hypothetical protein
MSNIRCPICGEVLQKYGEVDPDAGTSIVLGANCRKCGIRDSDIKLWQELIRTRKALEQSEICCTEWEKQALDYKAENIALSGDLECTRKALDVAVDALKLLNSEGKRTRILGLISITDTALGKIKTAL